MKKAVPLVLLLLLVALPAAAQDRSGTFEISPFGGGNFGGSVHTYSYPTYSYSTKLDVGDAGAYGVRFAYNFTNRAALEFAWAHARNGLFSGSSGAFAPNGPYASWSAAGVSPEV